MLLQENEPRIYSVTNDDEDILLVAKKLRAVMDVVRKNTGCSYTQKQLLTDISVSKKKPLMSVVLLQRLLAGPGNDSSLQEKRRIKHLTYKEASQIASCLSRKYLCLANFSVEDFDKDVTLEIFKWKLLCNRKQDFSELPCSEIDLRGREKDKKLLVDLLHNSPKRWINIQGRPGIGKTTLLSHVVKELIEEKKSFDAYIFITAEKWVKFDGDVIEISRSFHLEKVVDTILEKFPSDSVRINDPLEDKKAIVIKILNAIKILLVIDDVDSTVEVDLQSLQLDFSDKNKTRLLSTSTSHVAAEAYCLPTLVEGTIKEVAKETLKDFNVTFPKEELDQLVELCQGSLVAVKWIIKRLQRDNLSLRALIYKLRDKTDFWGEKDLRKYLYVYANNSLTEEYRWLLCFVLAAKEPVTVQQLKIVTDKSENEIEVIVEILLGLSLIEKRGEAYQVPLLAEYFLLKEVAPILRKFSLYAVAEMLCQIAVSAKEPTAPVWTEKMQVWRDLYPSFCHEGRKRLGVA